MYEIEGYGWDKINECYKEKFVYFVGRIQNDSTNFNKPILDRMIKQNKEIPKGYKDSPLGIIPEKWEMKRFGEIFSFKNGINTSKENYGKGVKFVNTMDVLANDSLYAGLLRGNVCVTEKQKREFAVSDGDILFNRTSETREEVGCSSVYLDDNEAVFGGFIIRARCLDNTLFDYYKKYCFKTNYIRNQITSFGNGAIRYNLGQEDLSKVTIILPPLPEQQKIAEILTTWDKAIEKQTALIEKLELRKRGLMQQLLTGKKRLKGLSESWKEYQIKDIANEVSLRNKANNKNIVVLSCTKYDGLVPSLDYFGRKIFADDLSTYKIVPKNNFAYATNHIEEGSIGYQSKFHEALISPMYTVFQTTEFINDSFLFALLKTHKYILEYRKRMEGSIDRRGGLRWDEFSKIKIMLPPFSEQIAIEKVLMATDKDIELARTKLITLRSQKNGLMQQLLTGKKRINYINF